MDWRQAFTFGQPASLFQAVDLYGLRADLPLTSPTKSLLRLKMCTTMPETLLPCHQRYGTMLARARTGSNPPAFMG
jgi:hypothetical protein